MWDANIVLRYCDAEKRLPKISANLSKCKLQSLSLVKNMLKSMDDNLMTSLKPSSQKEQLLPSLLMGAEHATANAMLLCINSDPDFRFEKFEHKEISLSNDIMSAAMLIHRYLTDVTNSIGK
ncbi:uncharacterized protein LOC132730746 [Ruditapes philippinarum]|uniref:uncharacterized protein LOC132730746 n=1 Tax=Ruditapes philippinarum TaxID=129788 RepID=UPI00295AE5D7|nr:uncharacterized protein LOC132730746 [Ruditapes philippinarum]